MPIRPRPATWFPLLALVASSACSGPRAVGDPAGTAVVEVPMPAFQASSVSGRGDAAPWTLTASDGSGLVLTRVDARAAFHGPLAFDGVSAPHRPGAGAEVPAGEEPGSANRPASEPETGMAALFPAEDGGGGPAASDRADADSRGGAATAFVPEAAGPALGSPEDRLAAVRITLAPGGYACSRSLLWDARVARSAAASPRVGDGRGVVRHAAAVEPQGPGGDRPSSDIWPPPGGARALAGDLAEIERTLATGDVPRAVALARAWHDRQPGDVLALVGLGDALEASHALGEAARIYGSIIDLYPARADLRRFAGERLERVGAEARALAIDTYRRAVAQRPDHLTGHRLLAYALLRAGRHADAFAAIVAGIDQRYPPGRFVDGVRVLGEDAGLIGAAWIAADPAQRAAVIGALGRRDIALASSPSTRFVMSWETDASDVDLHVQDALGGHAWYGRKQLPSGGELYADVTTGYGPECFTIPGTATAGPYRLSIHYYAQGPMGYGMGTLQILRHDGRGGLAFEDRPYVIMTDYAYVDLGTYAPGAPAR